MTTTFETRLTPDLVRHYTDAGYWTDRVITDFLDEHAGATPDATAFVDSRRSITFGELKQEADRCALGLLELGVGPGDVVSFQLPNWIEWIVLHLAVTRIGAVNNPLIPIYRDREVGFMMELVGSKLVVVPREFRGYDYPGMVERVRPQLPDLEHVLVVDRPAGAASSDGAASTDGTLDWDEFLATPWEERRDPAELAALRPDPNHVTLVIFTSGTTGEPKGVLHTHNTLVAANNPLPQRLGIDADTVFHMASTLAHLTGFLYGARLGIQNGRPCVLQDVWDATRFCELVEEHRVSYTSAATPFLHDLLQTAASTDRDLSSLRLFCCMGAPIPRVMVRRAQELLPGMTVLGGWGQTENALVTLGIPGDPEAKIVETDGYPWPGMSIRVVGPDGQPRAATEEGALQVEGPFVTVGYAHRPQLTEQAFHDGWFDTGDLATIDEDGYVKIVGRTKDIIIRGGENIPVAYVENILYEHPDIESLAVVGIPDPRLQEQAVLVCQMRDGTEPLTLESLRAFLGEKGVAKQYWPEHVRVVDALPRTASGKIQKFKVRDTVKDAR